MTQLSNDDGLDGVIDQDILGLNRVYLKAKRYKDGNVVGVQVNETYKIIEIDEDFFV